ncbi:MAG: fumarylacetoacetate hydrolase family protein [Acidobacteriaceae bacterium]|nr:fumarylacetoacetate hydrolase family protein [Acidobacteriaceae bacterium]MBV9937936.1 fumarylacetoacetate hydrolase family protein [Acidobacteriaceae bacterium]
MKLYRTFSGPVIEEEGRFYSMRNAGSWDHLITRDDLSTYLRNAISSLAPEENLDGRVEAPIESQEVWAAGVTYYRSREARKEESKSAGGGDFYHRVYEADRPELFFKATPHRVVGPGGMVKLRDDASWTVPEPELALLVTPNGKTTGYTIGNDMSSRDIEGENPLYLPQAKVYDRSCALGPCVLVSESPLPPSTEIRLEIFREGKEEFSGGTSLEAMKRTPASLVEYLYRNNSFPHGCYLLTGTGIVPPDSFTLENGDEIRITITGIGTLINRVG